MLHWAAGGARLCAASVDTDVIEVMMRSCVVRAIVASAVLTLVPSGVSATPQEPWLPLIFTQQPISAATSDQQPSVLERPQCDGSRIVRLDDPQSLTVLTADFASACDPEVSFDGTKILFAAKRHIDDPWNIFEMAADGSNPTQLTRDLGDCMEPLYLSRSAVTPPNFEDRVRWITFTSTAAGVLDDRGEAPAPSLYAMSMAEVAGRGTVLWRTTYNLGGDLSPTVLRDGRVLFSSRTQRGLSLATITWAGDNLNPFYGAHGVARYHSQAAELSDGSVAFIESDGSCLSRGGRLARVWLRRPLKSHELLSGDSGRYRTPHGAPGGELMVAHASGDESFALYLFDQETGRPGQLIYDDPKFHDVDPVPLRTHAEPAARIPMLEFASVLDIPGFEGAAQMHCMSVYDSNIEEIRRLAPGTVKWARFVQGIPSAERTSDADQRWPPPFVRTHSLGVAPVEPDGSFFVNIAGNVPFYIELLDADKKLIHTMHSWIWVRSGSQRGCIGCHEDKELAPQNRATDALIKMQPTNLTGSSGGD